MKTRLHRTAISRTALSMMLPLIATSGAAWAAEDQAASSPADLVIPEVTVTAEHRKENLQTTPIAVTNFTADTLDNQAIQDIRDLSGRAPGLYAAGGAFTHSSNSYYLRGIGESDAIQNQAVGTYIDDVYIPRPVGGTFELWDLQSVQVLRGPQGTLYGRNTSAGGIKVTTNDPTDKLRVFAEGGLGNYNDVEARVGFSSPVIENVLGVSLSVLHRKRDGTVDSVTVNSKVGDIDNNNVRLKLQYTPSEKLEFTFSADGFKDNGTPVPIIPRQQAGGLDPYRNFSNYAIGNQNNTGGASIRALYHIDDAQSIKVVSAFRAFDQPGWYDQDGQNINNSLTFSHHQDTSYSNEIQYQYDANPFHTVVGFFQLRDRFRSYRLNASDYTTSYSLLWAAGQNTVKQIGLEHTNSYAGYSQTTFDVLDNVHLTGGVRYTVEGHDFTYISNNTNAAGKYLTSLYQVHDTMQYWHSFTPKLIAAWEPIKDQSTYLSYSEGFKAGGFDNRASSLIAASNAFNPENVRTWEVGLKSNWLENRLRTNLAIYYNKISGFQASATDPYTQVSQRFNLGGATSEGVELETTAILAKGLNWTNNVSYDNTNIDAVVGKSATSLSYVGKHLLYTPRWTAFTDLNYILPYNFGTTGVWNVGGNVKFQSDAYNDYPNTWAARIPTQFIANLEGGYTSDDGHWQYLASIKNLLNRAYAQNSSTGITTAHLPAGTTAYTSSYNDPRTFLLRVRYTY